MDDPLLTTKTQRDVVEAVFCSRNLFLIFEVQDFYLTFVVIFIWKGKIVGNMGSDRNVRQTVSSKNELWKLYQPESEKIWIWRAAAIWNFISVYQYQT